jgi:hypothetical protein
MAKRKMIQEELPALTGKAREVVYWAAYGLIPDVSFWGEDNIIIEKTCLLGFLDWRECMPAG